MLRRIFACLFMFAILLLAGVLAQNRLVSAANPEMKDKPVWTMETVKASPEWIDYLEGGTLDEFLDQYPSVTKQAAIAALEEACLSVVSQLR